MFDLDLSDDYQVWDNTESVTLESTRTTGKVKQTVVEWTKRRKISTRELAGSSGAYQAGDVRFLLPAARVEGKPSPADWIVDDLGSRFIVLSVDGQKFSGGSYRTWVCTCRNLAIAYDLSDTSVVIEAPVITINAAGVAVRTWETRFSGFRCKVQKMLEETAEERAIRGFKGTYAIYLEQGLAVSEDMRVVWSAAPTGYLEIVKYDPSATIDYLPVIHCEAAV